MIAAVPDEKTIEYHFQQGKKSFDNGKYVLAESSFEHTKRLLKCRLTAPHDPDDRNQIELAIQNMQGLIQECRGARATPTLSSLPQKTPLGSTSLASTKGGAANEQGATHSILALKPDLSREQALMEAKAELDAMIGLKSVKKHLQRIANNVEGDLERKAAGIISKVKISRHFVLMGKPGTGKTTVAQLIGKLLYGIGYLDKGHTVEGHAENLTGKWQGHSEDFTKTAFEEALDGVLFIDEAYSLAEGNEGDFGKKIINVLNRQMEEKRDRMVVIAAGYKDKMRQFLNANAGLERKFTIRIELPDYSPSELTAIALKLNRDAALKASGEFYMRVHTLCSITEATADELIGHGNGGFVRDQILGRSMDMLNERLAKTRKADTPRSGEFLTSLEPDDLPFEELCGIPWSIIDRDQIQWELKRENGDVIQMDADTVGQYFANMTDHRVLDEGQPELTPASKQYLAELVGTVN